jgi:hypothetical protein
MAASLPESSRLRSQAALSLQGCPASRTTPGSSPEVASYASYGNFPVFFWGAAGAFPRLIKLASNWYAPSVPAGS